MLDTRPFLVCKMDEPKCTCQKDSLGLMACRFSAHARVNSCFYQCCALLVIIGTVMYVMRSSQLQEVNASGRREADGPEGVLFSCCGS